MSFLDDFFKEYEKEEYQRRRKETRPNRIIVFVFLGLALIWAIIRAYRLMR